MEHPAELTLYTAPGTCARATHLALEHARAPYIAVRLNFAQQQQRSPEYLRLNPKGRVPTLVTPQGALTETPALLLYVAQRFPQSGLAPLDDPFELARLNAFNSYLSSTVHVAHAHRMRGSRWADDEAAIAAMKLKVPQNMADCFTLIEEQFFGGPWVLGGAFSVSDYYMFTISAWLEGDGVDIRRFPRVAEHYQRMAELPVVRQVLSAEASS